MKACRSRELTWTSRPVRRLIYIGRGKLSARVSLENFGFSDLLRRSPSTFWTRKITFRRMC